MLYELVNFSDQVSALNVFRYITFRSGAATITALLFVFLFGPTIIAALRARQGKGQPIRTDGPQSHLVTKKGTPTMGGLMILSGFLVSTLLWANLTSIYVWVVLGVTIAFGLIGLGMQITAAALKQAGGKPLIIGGVVGTLKAVGSLIVVLMFVKEFV